MLEHLSMTKVRSRMDFLECQPWTKEAGQWQQKNLMPKIWQGLLKAWNS
jgi:hypothetical protein